jgi:hypothetical protein
VYLAELKCATDALIDCEFRNWRRLFHCAVGSAFSRCHSPFSPVIRRHANC